MIKLVSFIISIFYVNASYSWLPVVPCNPSVVARSITCVGDSTQINISNKIKALPNSKKYELVSEVTINNKTYLDTKNKCDFWFGGEESFDYNLVLSEINKSITMTFEPGNQDSVSNRTYISDYPFGKNKIQLDCQIND